MKIVYYFFALSLLWVSMANCFCLTKYTDTSNFDYEKDEDTNTEINAWVILNNTPAYNCFKENQKVLKHLEIRYRYRVVKDNYSIKSDGKLWSLLVIEGEEKLEPNNIVGWVSHDALLFNYLPLTNEKTGINIKALINRGDTDGGKILKVYENRAGSSSNEGIEVRTVFYVYDYYPHSSAYPESQETKRLLISPKSILDSFAKKEPLLVGWVDRQNVTFWNTRTAFEFPVGSTLEVTDDQGNVVFRPERVQQPLPFNSLRNPILREEGNYYYIGTFARLQREQLITRTQLTDIETGLEILFVIDGTRSMSKAFHDTMGGVRQIAESLTIQSNKNNLEQPRFGLTFYRDRATMDPVRIGKNGSLVNVNQVDYCKREYNSYQFGNYDNFCSLLQDQIACDGDTTRPESLYNGLVEAVRNSNFLRGNDERPLRMRIIIHIGDAGDNGQSRYTPEIIASEFNRYYIFKYIAIDVSKSSEEDFARSVKPIVSALNNAEYIQRPPNLSKAVILNLRKFNRNAAELNDQINIISRGFAGTTKGRIGVVSPEILKYAKEVIKANNIDLSQYNAFQQYVEGRVPKNSRINKYLLVTFTDLEKISYFLTGLIETSESESKAKTWDHFLKIIIGEESCIDYKTNQEISIEDCNKKRSGIPIKASFMKMTKSEFLNLNSRDAQNIHCESKQAREQFRYFRQDKKILNITMLNSDNCTFDVVSTLDLNGDGLIIRDKKVSDLSQNFIRAKTIDDLEDKFFFKEGVDESVAWIPLKNFINEEDQQ